MFSELLVPYAEERDHVALEVAVALARRNDASVSALLHPPTDGNRERSRHLRDEIYELGDRLGIEINVIELEPKWSRSSAVVDEQAHHPDSVICVMSPGRGRTAFLSDSIANDILVDGCGPVVFCGPKCEVDPFAHDGPVITSVDGTTDSELAIPLAYEWALAFDRELEVVNVLAPNPSPEAAQALASGDVMESNYLHSVLKAHSEIHGSELTFDVLHGDPAEAIQREVVDRDAPLVVVATHAPSGLERIIHGSTLAEIVRHSPVPVLTVETRHEHG